MWCQRPYAALTFLLCAASVRADFGDYADYTFQCPYLTTCPAVCVAEQVLCPESLVCPEGEMLCVDGSCAPVGEPCSTDLSNPCEENSCGFTVTCARAINTTEECDGMFGNFYAEYDECATEEPEPSKVSWTSTGFVICYAWIGTVTALIIGFCAVNQRLAPIGQALPLDDFSSGKNRRKSSYPVLGNQAKGSGAQDPSKMMWTQTAYKATLIGRIIYALTVVTFWGFQALLAILVAFFYAQQDGRGTWNGGVNPFEDEVQVLAVFEVVWVAGFVWSFSMKWPSSIHSLFLRRCQMAEADYVAVFAPSSNQLDENTGKSSYIIKIKKVMNCMFGWVNSVMGFLLSDVTRPDVLGEFSFCRVTRHAGGKSFYFRLRRYNFNADAKMYLPGRMELGKTISDLIELKNGLPSDVVDTTLSLVGPNKIDMKRPTFIGAAINEFSRLFYVYQIYITWTWFNFWYWYMGVVNSFVYLIGGLSVSYVKYQNDKSLHQLSKVGGTMEVFRDGQFQTIPQEDLVPGDCVRLKSGITSCDMVLLSADNGVVVDESALTGEATPVAKAELDPAEGKSMYDPSVHKKHSIYAGTTILDNESGANHIAVVIKTGSFTTKGELLRDILFYERHRFKFDVELDAVLLILVVYAIVAFAVTVAFYRDFPVYSFFYGMYVVATAIPPLLPTVFVVSVGVSSERLLQKKIACSNAQDILVAGKVKRAFFDKTGTLTKQGLDFLSSQSYTRGLSNSVTTTKFMAQGMAACHTLSKVESGQYLGNSVDVVMFEASGARMSKDTSGESIITLAGGNALTVLKRFEFDHSRMTQSVVVRDNSNGAIMLYVKGSADNIRKRCNRESLPNDFESMTTSSAKKGVYQISLAARELPRELAMDYTNISRDELEAKLDFIGFVNFKNVLRPESARVLQELESGDVRSVMVTGDSVFTGIHIARESGMIKEGKQVLLGQLDHLGNTIQWMDADTDKVIILPPTHQLGDRNSNIELALTGEAWQALTSESRMQLGDHVSVFGRCTPNDKVSIVSAFVKRGFITLMCGDGGNDCGALKTAHVGIALSDAEASVVSPFTSLDKSIASVPELLKEGRCGLANAFSSYKYMIMYGQIETLTQIMNAYYGITFSEWGWVWMDGVWLLTMAFSLPLSKAAKKLFPVRPTASLLGPHTMSSTVGIFVINFFFIVIGLVALKQQDWYQCRMWESTDVSNLLVISDNYETAVIWLISGYQYVSTAVAYNFGFQFRAAWYKNYVFVVFALGWTAIHYYVILVPSKLSCFFRVNCDNEDTVRGVLSEVEPIHNPWNTTVMPKSLRGLVAGLITINLVCNVCWEYFVVNGLQRKIARKIGEKNAQAKIASADEEKFEEEEVVAEAGIASFKTSSSSGKDCVTLMRSVCV